MKKIIFITNTLSIGGADKVCANLENMFYNDGFETLTLSIQNYGKNYKILGKHKFIGINSKKIFPFKSYITLFVSCIKYRKIIKIFKPDIIMSNAYNPNLINLIISKYGKQKRILIHHENTTKFKNNFHGFGKLTYILINKLVFFLIKKDDTIVCVSNHSAQDLKNNYKIRGKIEVIYNGIDTKKIKELSQEKLNLDFPFIVNIGNMNENKNQILLIKAYEKIHENISEHLVFLGTGPNESTLKNYVKEAGLDDKIHFLGFQSNPYKYLKNANLMVHTAFVESMSLSILESISLGIPIITTKNGSQEDIVGDSNCAIILDKFDENELADKILEILNDKNLQKDLREKGLSRAENFTIEKQFEKYKKLII